MKTTFFTFVMFVFMTASLHSQNINNTLGSTGVFTIKDGTTTFLTLSQSDGYLGLTRSLTLPQTTGSTVGVIYKGTDRFIHDYKGAGTTGFNTFVGVNSGNFSLGGTFTIYGSHNTAVGFSTLTSLTSGYYNSAMGYQALYNNRSGVGNSAFGYLALYSNTGNENSAFGRYAGTGITTGSNNICIGYDAQVPDGTASNQVRIGHTFVSYAGVQVAWTVTSDRKWKTNIAKSGLGLDFISKLNPVSYTRKNDEKGRLEYGLIAQELEEVLKEAGVENAGMITVDDRGRYELRYNDLLAPMVKAIQELEAENDELRSEVASLRGSIAEQVKAEIEKVLLKAVQPEETTVKVSLNEPGK